MTLRRELSSRPAGPRMSQGMSQTAERQAQQRQARQPEDGTSLAYDTYGQVVVVPAAGVQLLGLAFASAPSAADAQILSDKLDELITKLTDGGFLDEEIGTQGGATAVPDGSGLYAASVGDGSALAYVVTHGFTSKDVQVTVWDNTTPFAEVYPMIEHTSTTTVTLRFTTAPSSNRYRVVVVG